MLTLSLSGQDQLPVYEKEVAVRDENPITFETLLQELTDRTMNPETFNELFITQPFGSANTGEGGISVNSRVRSLDAIPFNKSLRFDMESWQTLGGPVKYSVACFWYGKTK